MDNLHVPITGDDNSFASALADARSKVKATSREIEQNGKSIEKVFDRMKLAAAGVFAGFSAKEFIQKVASVRGEFQKLEVAFTTMLGSADKANALMQQLTKTAATTPFDLQGVTNGAKQLLAYGIESEKVNDTLIHLGDIAAGLSLPLTDLVYLYGTTMVQGRMFTQDLRQFQNRGIPIAEELAKVLGVTKDKVQELVSTGKVGAKEFNQAIMAMSSEGGKFAGLMEAQSKTITGQLSNIEDAIQSMFNEIGQQSEGIINESLSVVSSLIENYEKVGKVILSLVGIYGAYKTAVMVVSALESFRAKNLLLQAVGIKGVTAAEAVHYYWLVLCEKAQKLLNKTMLANPYVLVAAAAAGLVAVMWNMKSQQDRVNDALDDYNRHKEETIANEEKHKNKINELVQIAGDESLSTDTRRIAMMRLMEEYPDLFNKYHTEIEALKDIAKWKEKIAELEGKKTFASAENELAYINEEIRKLEEKGKATFETVAAATAGGVSYIRQTGGRTKAEEARLKALKKQRLQVEGKVQKEQEEAYFKDLTGLSNEELEAKIKEREALIKRLDAMGAGENVKIGDAHGTYSRNELQAQQRMLEFEQNRRAQIIADGSKNFVNEARKAYKKESDELNRLRSLTDPKKRAASKMEVEVGGKMIKASELSADQLADLIAKQEEKAEDAKKKLEKLSGRSVKGDTDKAERERERLLEQQKKEEEERKKLLKQQIDDMHAYLREYGSFEQKKLAITEEYEQKIKDAKTEGEKLILQKQKEQDLSSLSYEEISKGIDWKTLFSGVGSLAKEMMQPMMDQLQAYTRTDEYLKADSQTQRDVVELIQELRQYLGSDQSVTWENLEKAIEDFSASVDAYNKAVVDERVAMQRVDEAKVRLAKGEISKEEYDKILADAKKFGDATVSAKKSMEGFATKLNDTTDEVANYTSKLSVALNNAKGWKNLEGFGNIQQSAGMIDDFKSALDSALPSFGGGMAETIGDKLSSSIGEGLSSLGSGLSNVLSSGMGQMIGFIAQIPKLILEVASAIKNFVTGIIDTFTELISLRWIDDLVNSILGAIDNLVNAIFDLPENLYKVLESIAVKGIGGLLNTVIGRIGNVLSFGALSSKGPSDWFTNSNAKEVAKSIDNLTDRNKLLTQAIEDLTDEMAKARGAAAIEISSQAAKLQRETNENLLEIAKEQAGYHSAHNSWNYYWGGYSQEQINRLSGQIGREWNGDIWDLTPEEMKMLRSNVDMWEQIINTGKGGYGESVADKLNDYIEQAGKLQEITDKLYENLTTTTKENVFNDFLSDLYDLADGSEDVFDDIADSWQKMVNKMVVNNLVGARFQKNLEAWYEELAKLNESKVNGELSDADYKRRLELLKAEYEGYVTEAQKDIETLRDNGIISEAGEYKQ